MCVHYPYICYTSRHNLSEFEKTIMPLRKSTKTPRLGQNTAPKRAISRLRATRADRIDVRITPETKALLVRAATLRGSNLTTFMLESAQERAVELIERYERLSLTNRDRDTLLSALDHPPAPAPALRKAFQKYARPSSGD